MEGLDSDRLLALADDLTGAGEVAAALMLLETRIILRLMPSTATVTPPLLIDDARDSSPGALVVDLDCRHRAAEQVADRVRSAVVRHRPSRVLAKIDSLLRGSPQAIVHALRADRAPVVVATALPAAGRVVIDGVVRLAGLPLSHTDAWRMEPGDPPESLTAALAPMPTELVSLDTVRASGLAGVLQSIVAAEAVAVCDAETDSDLDLVAAAALTLPSVRVVGSGGLAAAVARSLAPVARTGPPAPQAPPHGPRPVLVVVGTAEPVAVEQSRRLVAAGLHQVGLVAEALQHRGHRSAAADRVRAAIGNGPCVVTLAPPGDRRTAPDAVARHLAHVVAEALRVNPRSGQPVALVLTGGETARRVLDALGVDTLTPIGQIQPGAVHCVTPDGRAIVTKAGSFGNADSLLDIVHSLNRTPCPKPDLVPAQREVLP